MVKESQLVNINCPMCGTPLVTSCKGKTVQGILIHKCSKCKRYWMVNYTEKTVIWFKGKEEKTPVKKCQLDIDTGDCYPLKEKEKQEALLRREGA